jgi:hypothetical protein
MSRRLRVELMERRMMLSANAPSVESPQPLFAMDAGDVRYVSGAATQVSLVTPVADGGFVNGVFFDFDGPISTTRSNFDAAPTITDLVNEDSDFGSFDEIGDVEANGQLYGTSGIVPHSYEVLTSGGPSPMIQLDETASVTVAEEGGWISIKSILDPHAPAALVKEDEALAVAEPANLLSQLGADDRESSADESLAQISGEWARAAVFEIAGGEPPAATLSMTEPHTEFDPASSSSFEAQSAEMSTFTNADGEQSKPNTPDAADPTQASERAAESTSDMSSQDDDRDVAVHSNLENADILAQVPLGIPLFERVSSVTGVVNVSSPSADDVLAAAFDEIGDAELAVAAPLTDNLRLSHWLSSTPLLLMFALERVTARRSRTRQAVRTTERSRRVQSV